MLNKLHLLEIWMLRKVNQYIRRAKLISYSRYKPNHALKILIIGYGGKKNIGAEVRCAEIIKQIKTFKLPISLEFGVLTLDPLASQTFYTDDVKFIKLSSIFFDDLLKSCSDYHMGILAEGSCLTSVTSNVAALFFICTAGMFKAQNKLCLGYGVEAGPMPAAIFATAKNHCSDTFFIARTENSKLLFDQLGLRNTLGTDTAWTIEALPNNWAQNELQHRYGITNKAYLVGISPINPFIRPIYPSIGRYFKSALTRNWHGHYDKIYFYTISKERDQQYNNYLQAIHHSISALTYHSSAPVVPIYIEMEPMDKKTVSDLQYLNGNNGIVLSASQYNGVELTALLRQLSLLLTSRYHAHVLSMPSGVPCVAISKDSRLTDIFNSNGLSEYCISTRDTFLPVKLPEICINAYKNSIFIKEELLNKVPSYLQTLDSMGQQLRKFIIDYIGTNT